MSTETPGPTTARGTVPTQRSGAGAPPTSPAVPAAAPPVQGGNYRTSLPWRLYDGVSQLIDRAIGWDRLPVPGGLAVLLGVRNILRQLNLHDPSSVVPVAGLTAPPRTPEHLTQRSVDGSHNDLDQPAMGMARARFGRNVPLDAVLPVTDAELTKPSAREVSRRLLTRHSFQPAETVNMLAAAWLQFMVRDWFSHGQSDTSRIVEVPLAPGDTWWENPMRIPRIELDPTRPDGAAGPVTTINEVTHWWDGSSIYGSTPEQQQQVRTGQDGKLRLDERGHMPLPEGENDPTRVPGFWTGLVMLPSLFMREHNAICDRLKAEYPSWDDEQLFQRARLVNAALMAKIHTVEWTPAIISHPTTVVAMHANWYGLAGERIHRTFGRISSSELISGIPGADTHHYGVPFSLTEEFTAVYRMHPLMRDEFELRAAADDGSLAECTFRELAGPNTRTITERFSLEDLFYSFGVAHPGAIVLRNFPRFLQEYQRPDGKVIDLAATDIVRIRELGVPRYCAFRRQLHMTVPATFAELTDDAELAAEIEELYEGDIEQVDLMVGLFAEKRPEGFAFSDTAFRIFILMASRRLNSDRFFTRDFRPEIYSPAGLAWIRDNDMRTVLLRHLPTLRASLRGVDNAFAPWKRTSQAG